MAGCPATLNNEKGVLDVGLRLRQVFRRRGKWVDQRNGEEEIPAGDEPDPAKGSRTLN